MTIKDIAIEAGVSASTVSRVLNDSTNTFATPAVRNRIWEIVRKNQYVPNATARSLKRGNQAGVETHNHMIACYLPRPNYLAGNPFYSEVTRAIEQKLLQEGYTVPYYFTQADTANPVTLQHMLSLQVDGVVVVGKPSSRDIAAELARRYKNIVYVGRTPIDAAWDQVFCSAYDGTREAMRYLLKEGHQKIGYVGQTAGQICFQGYQDALAEAV